LNISIANSVVLAGNWHVDRGLGGKEVVVVVVVVVVVEALRCCCPGEAPPSPKGGLGTVTDA
jgi:hypothetical protein